MQRIQSMRSFTWWKRRSVFKDSQRRNSTAKAESFYFSHMEIECYREVENRHPNKGLLVSVGEFVMMQFFDIPLDDPKLLAQMWRGILETFWDKATSLSRYRHDRFPCCLEKMLYLIKALTVFAFERHFYFENIVGCFPFFIKDEKN